jgi:hypothetical protein
VLCDLAEISGRGGGRGAIDIGRAEHQSRYNMRFNDLKSLVLRSDMCNLLLRSFADF